MSEQWDLYTKDRVKTGRVIERGKPMPAEGYHLVVHVIILNANKEMLIQQRQPFKEGWSNLWDLTVGGSALAGETSQQAAERELYEEIGLKYDFSAIRPFFTVNFEQGFDDYYIVFKAPKCDELILQAEEVQAVKWASQSEIHEMIDRGIFIPYYHEFIDMIFQMNQAYGSIRR